MILFWMILLALVVLVLFVFWYTSGYTESIASKGQPEAIEAKVAKRNDEELTLWDLRKQLLIQAQDTLSRCFIPVNTGPFIIRRNQGDYGRPQPVSLDMNCLDRKLTLVPDERYKETSQKLMNVISDAYSRRCQPPESFISSTSLIGSSTSGNYQDDVLDGNKLLDGIMGCLEYDLQLNRLCNDMA